MTPKKANLLLSIMLIITIIIIGIAIYGGKRALANSSQKVVNAKLEVIKAEKKENTYLKNRQIYLDNEKLAGKINALIPNEKEQAIVVESIYSFANEAGLPINSITFPGSNLDPSAKTKTKIDISQATPVKDLQNVFEIPIEITIKGGSKNSIATDNLLRFIESIESSPRNMRITDISYDVESSEVKISLSLFVKK
jgi:hypothetical protein